MRRIVLFRHGLAEDAVGAMPDAARELTDQGRNRTARAAQGLKRLLGAVDLLAASPLVRTTQTADILQLQLQAAARASSRLLETEAPVAAVLQWLEAEQGAETVVLVGHEPHLNTLAGLALTGQERDFLVFRKSSACLLEFSDAVGSGLARMRWFMSWSQLACQ